MDENNIGEVILGRAIKAPIALGPGCWKTLTKRVSPLNFNVPRM